MTAEFASNAKHNVRIVIENTVRISSSWLLLVRTLMLDILSSMYLFTLQVCSFPVVSCVELVKVLDPSAHPNSLDYAWAYTCDQAEQKAWQHCVLGRNICWFTPPLCSLRSVLII